MRLHADFTQRIVIRPDGTPWQGLRILVKTGHLDEVVLRRWAA